MTSIITFMSYMVTMSIFIAMLYKQYSLNVVIMSILIIVFIVLNEVDKSLILILGHVLCIRQVKEAGKKISGVVQKNLLYLIGEDSNLSLYD